MMKLHGPTPRTAPGILLLLVLSAASVLGPAPVRAQDGAERLFYYVDRESSWESLRRNVEEISVVAPAWYSVDAEGVVWGEVDPLVLELAAAHDVGVMPLIVNPGFDQEMLHELLVDDEARRRAVESMVELCRRHGFLGIQFDFENVAMTDRDAFTRFYRETAEALHAEGFRISAAVVHRPDELPGPTRYHAWLFENWRAGYDLEAMGRIGDFLSIMSYSQHTRRTPPGPQAGLAWQRDVVEYFLRFVPPEKLSLGIPTGSQHWSTHYDEGIRPEMARSYSEGVSHAWALHLVDAHDAELRWSEEDAVPYAFYPVGGTFEWIFLEDARSFEAKLGLVDEFGLRGFSAWVLGPEDPGVWEVLERRSR